MLSYRTAINIIKFLSIIIGLIGAVVFAFGTFLLVKFFSQNGLEIILFPILIILLGITCLAIGHNNRKNITPKSIESLFAITSFFIFIILTKVSDLITENYSIYINEVQGLGAGISALPFLFAFLFYKVTNRGFAKSITNR
jgi:hypothetical protein